MITLDTTLKKYEEKGLVGKGNSFLMPHNKPMVDYPRLPFDIFPLDFILAGGVPVNQPVQLVAPMEAGKSLHAYLLARAASRYCIKCLRPLSLCTCGAKLAGKTTLIHTEGLPPERRWFETLQYDIDSYLHMAIPEYGEQGCEMIEAAIAAEDCGLVIVDSIASMRPKAELECDYLEDTMGKHAKMASQLIYRLSSRLSSQFRKGHFVAVVFINQMRAKYNAGRFEAKEGAPGAWSLKHSYRLSMRISQLALKTDAGERDKTTGQKNVLHFSNSLIGESTKQQIFTMGGKCEWKLALEPIKGYKVGQAMDAKLVKDVAEEVGLFVKEGKTYRFKGTRLEFATQEEFLSVLRTGVYNGKKGMDTVFRYIVLQEAKRQELAQRAAQGETVLKAAIPVKQTTRKKGDKRGVQDDEREDGAEGAQNTERDDGAAE